MFLVGKCRGKVSLSVCAKDLNIYIDLKMSLKQSCWRFNSAIVLKIYTDHIRFNNVSHYNVLQYLYALLSSLNGLGYLKIRIGLSEFFKLVIAFATSPRVLPQVAKTQCHELWVLNIKHTFLTVLKERNPD